MKLYIADDLNVDHRTYAPDEERPCVEVRAVTIDHFVAPQDRVDVIKMDIRARNSRGAWCSALLSSRPAPILMFEYWPYGLCSAGHNPDDLIAELESAGYEPSTVGNAPFPARRRQMPMTTSISLQGKKAMAVGAILVDVSWIRKPFALEII